jgi:hypothetical protein
MADRALSFMVPAMRPLEPGRIGPRAGSGSCTSDTPAEWPRTTALLQLRLPPARIDQLQALAERQGQLATTMVSEWVLAHLAEHDPEDALLPVPSHGSLSGARLASVTRLPRLDATDESPVIGPAAGAASAAPAPRPEALSAAAARMLPARRRPPGSEAHPAGMRLPGATRPGSARGAARPDAPPTGPLSPAPLPTSPPPTAPLPPEPLPTEPLPTAPLPAATPPTTTPPTEPRESV